MVVPRRLRDDAGRNHQSARRWRARRHATGPVPPRTPHAPPSRPRTPRSSSPPPETVREEPRPWARGEEAGPDNRLGDVIEKLKAAGTAILLTTHRLDEVERLCGRVAILVAGKIVARAPPREIRRQVSGLSRRVLHEVSYPVGKFAAALSDALTCELRRSGRLIHLGRRVEEKRRGDRRLIAAHFGVRPARAAMSALSPPAARALRRLGPRPGRCPVRLRRRSRARDGGGVRAVHGVRVDHWRQPRLPRSGPGAREFHNRPAETVRNDARRDERMGAEQQHHHHRPPRPRQVFETASGARLVPRVLDKRSRRRRWCPART